MKFSDSALKMLDLLADGNRYSTLALANRLALSQAVVEEQIRLLTLGGVELLSDAQGFYLKQALDLFKAEQIEAGLSLAARQYLAKLEIYTQIDSTNRYLLACSERDRSLSGWVCLAESQTAGRGQRGRIWVSPLGCNFYGSVLWRFPYPSATIAGLSLAVGVAVIRALTVLGVSELSLKWPNDVYARGKKLGGILIEVATETNSCCAVVGLGVNVSMPVTAGAAIDQAWIDLEQLIGSSVLSRNTLASHLVNQLLPVIANFASDGLTAYLAEWRRYDLLLHQTVSVKTGDGSIQGTAMGIDDHGCLVVLTAEGSLKTFVSGEVSVRLPQ
jgi:BirA family biotin operon repressor/biotin-[acetyl-CoA-carboxylase] ligase